MKILTDSYYIPKNDFVRLSGEVINGDEFIDRKLSQLCGGNATVTYCDFNEYAKDKIKNEFNIEYTDNSEAYFLEISTDGVMIFANSRRAKLYAAYSLIARYEKDRVECCSVYSSPIIEHRSMRIFLPPKSEILYFEKFLDMLVELGYNTVVLEIGGSMEFKSHPEINSTWYEYCQSMKEYNEKVYVAQSGYKRVKNSIHTFNANGDIYSQDEVKDIIKMCKERALDIIPEVPSLSHSEYILISHPEMRECDDEDYASTMCPLNEEGYKLVFELYDEVINVFEPEILHIGHDEWWVMCICDKCKDKNAAELYAYNVKRSYYYLKAKGIKTMLWADKMKAVTDKTGECHGGARKEIYSLTTDKKVTVMGKDYTIYDNQWFNHTEEAKKNGFLHVIHNTEDCIDLLPKDIICMNWYHTIDPEINDVFLRKGFYSIYANCRPASLGNCKERFDFGAKGISISSWTVTREYDLQLWQGTFFQLGYGSLLAWNKHHDEFEFEKNSEEVREQLFRRRNNEALSAHHLSVKHRLLKTDAELEMYFVGKLPYCDDEKLTLGEYSVQYSNGTEERIPVIYAINISIGDVKTSRKDSASSWCYASDAHIEKIVPSALPIKTDSGFVYKVVHKLNGDVSTITYIPKEEYKDLVEVVEINII